MTSGEYRTIERCEVCGNTELEQLLDLGHQPMCDDLVRIGDDRTPKLYPIVLLGCRECVTVHQKYQIKRETLFPGTYHYRAAMTKDVLNGMSELVSLASTLVGDLAGKVVLDIGCNDGSLLGKFRQAGATTIGIEPTGAAKDAEARVDHVINDYFGPESVETYLKHYERPDIVTFTNVFAHIDDLDQLLASLTAVCKETTTVIIENHYLGSVLEKHQFDTFYHEHPRTYSLRSFAVIAERLNMEIGHVDFPSRYNGNIRVAMSPSFVPVESPRDETRFISEFAALEPYVNEVRASTMARIRELAAAHGPLPAKAFPGRAAVIISYYGLDETLISATYEQPGSPKIGHYIPGTRIPILDERELFQATPAPVCIVNFAWHISREIETHLRNAGFQGEILDVFN